MRDASRNNPLPNYVRYSRGAMIALRIAVGRPCQAAITCCKSASTEDRERQSGPPECSTRAAPHSVHRSEVEAAFSVASKSAGVPRSSRGNHSREIASGLFHCSYGRRLAIEGEGGRPVSRCDAGPSNSCDRAVPDKRDSSGCGGRWPPILQITEPSGGRRWLVAVDGVEPIRARFGKWRLRDPGQARTEPNRL